MRDSRDPEQYSNCWCGRVSYDGHLHFGLTPVEFGRRPRRRFSANLVLLVLAIISATICGVLLTSCATLKACDAPLSGQALSDGAAVLLCVATQGKTLAACEEAQIAVEAGQVTSDVLVCAESAVASAAKGSHTTADGGTP